MQDQAPARDRLFFYSKSASKPPPGKGVNEHVADARAYAALPPDWRRMLSNFWPCELRLDGLTFASVEHYYHHCKYARTAPDFARRFAIESGSAFCRDPARAKTAGGKTGGAFRPAGTPVDADFMASKPAQAAAFRRAMAVKFALPPLRDVLLATRDAELWHGTRGVRPHLVIPLMQVRAALAT